MEQDLNYIEAARIGHIEMLQAIFGAPTKPGEIPAAAALPDEAPPITPELFDAAFGRGKVTHA
jgi:hypothetical protein